MAAFISRLLCAILPSGRAPSDSAAAAPPPLLSAPIHVLRDDGLVRLVDGQLAFGTETGIEMQVRIDEVGQLSLFGSAGVTSPCIRELMRRGIPVVWRSSGGHYSGQSLDLSGQSTAVRRAQYCAAANPVRRMAIARALVRAKIVNTRGYMRRNGAGGPQALANLRRLAHKAGTADHASLLGIEGAAAAAFYSAMPAMIAEQRRRDFPWEGRRRRPPPDPINSLLSYLYAVLAGECATAALAASLDPYVGFLHAERPGRPALALDLMEPFRPTIADSATLAVVNRGEIRPEHFQTSATEVRLNDQGRRIALAGLERRLAEAAPGDRTRSISTSWREAIGEQARSLAASLRSGDTFVAVERA